MGLSGANTQSLVHQLPHRDLVHEATIDTRDRKDAARTANVDHLSQYMGTIILEQHHLLGPIEDRIWLPERDVRLGPDTVDALLRPLAIGQLVELFDDAFFLEIDG